MDNGIENLKWDEAGNFTSVDSINQLNRKKIDRKFPQLLSFFCGAGGLDLGFKEAGFEIALAIDLMQAAVDTHNANFGSTRALVRDLLTLDAEQIKDALVGLNAGIAPVGIIGGPPCQGFSKANTQRSSSDPRNNLAIHYANLIVQLAVIYPIKFFVFENVLGILNEEYDEILSNLKNTLSKEFHIFSTSLNAEQFGVPQSRERFFMVGIRKIENEAATFNFPVPFTAPLRTVRDAIGHLPQATLFRRGLVPEEINHHPNHWTMRPVSKRFSADLKSTGRSLFRLDWDKPSRTVAYGHREIHVHPTGLRRLTILEAMLLQGFPETYKLSGNLSQQVTQVSNAVPPPVAKAIAMQILESINLLKTPKK